MEYGRITEAELAGFGAFLRSEERILKPSE